MTDKVQTRTIGSVNHTIPSEPNIIRLQYWYLTLKLRPNKFDHATLYRTVLYSVGTGLKFLGAECPSSNYD
jgi:hypothetical protein